MRSATVTLVVMTAAVSGGCTARPREMAVPAASRPLATPVPPETRATPAMAASLDPADAQSADGDAAVPPAATDAVFARDVQPVLARRCAPCHVPGGVMYGRMPFDDPATVRGHKDGILRRIKEPAERGALEAWLGLPARP